MSAILMPSELRARIRSGEHTGNTSGVSAGFVQCNIVILPKDWAAEFLQFCQLNQKPCLILTRHLFLVGIVMVCQLS